MKVEESEVGSGEWGVVEQYNRLQIIQWIPQNRNSSETGGEWMGFFAFVRPVRECQKLLECSEKW